MRLKYNEKPNHRIGLPGGGFAYGGEEFTCDDAFAQRCLDDKSVPVTVIKETPKLPAKKESPDRPSWLTGNDKKESSDG